jgi:predicted Zn-dependent protease
MMASTMETYFNDVAALLDRSLAPGEIYLCRFDAEISDFVRMNRGKVRQPGTVSQRYLALRLIRGKRHAERSLTVSGDLARDRADIDEAVAALRGALDDLPDDPHLDYATEVCSSRTVKTATLAHSEQIVTSVLDAAQGLDLVGIYAAGPVYRGFANSFGQRNWHEVSSFNLQWSLYHRTDKAVKTSYGGFEWSAADFGAKMHEARARLALLSGPSHTLEPGRYRAYLAPSAMEELAGLLCWGGFSGRALATRQSCLFRMQDGAAALDPAIAFAENIADGIAPAFQDEGFARPDNVPLLAEGRLVGSLVSPRTAKEFALETNGANTAEMPEALDMAAGNLPLADTLAALDTGIYVGNLWYLNFSDRPACRVTGMTRFASFWVEHGKIVAPVNVMRFDDSVFRLLGDHLVGLTSERELIVNSDTYRARNVGSMRLPGAVVSEMAFTL